MGTINARLVEGLVGLPMDNSQKWPRYSKVSGETISDAL